MAQLVIERTEGSLADRFRPYKVFIDGEMRGRIASKEVCTFDVGMGVHSVRFGVDFYRTPAIKVAVLDQTRLVCRSGLAHAFGLLWLVAPSSWIALREEDEVVAPPPPAFDLPICALAA
jgi:hypothetical protein